MNERTGGFLLLAATLGMLVTMSLHPTGHDLAVPERLEGAARLAGAVHALAIACLPLSFLGAWTLARRLGGLGEAGLVLHALGLACALAAATASGWIGPDLARARAEAGPGEAALWSALLHTSGLVNQAFARLLVAASSVALFLWSLALRRRAVRGLATYGLVLAPVTLLALLSGHLRLDVHGFGAVVLAQSVWMVWAGLRMVRADPGGPGAGTSGTSAPGFPGARDPIPARRASE